MTRSEYIKTLEQLPFDREKFCIISGGTMVMYKLREKTEDIDIKMLPEYFEAIRSSFTTRQSPKFDYLFEVEVNNDVIEVAVQEFTPNNIVKIDNFLVEKLERQLEWKKAHNRSKDETDIKIIERYLKTSQPIAQ